MKLLATIACLVLTCGASRAQEANPPDPALAELKREIGVRDQVIRNLIGRIEQLERAVAQIQKQDAGSAQSVVAESVAKAETPAQSAGQSAGQSTSQSAEQSTPLSQDSDRIRVAFERTLIERGGLVLPKWNWQFDVGLSYGHSSSEALTIDGFTVYPVLIVGDIVSERVRRDTLSTSLTAHLGLPWQTQIDVRVPYTYENSDRVSAAGDEHSISDSGIGDIEIGFSRPLWRSSGGLDLLAGLSYKTTTGRDPFELGESDADRVPFGTGFNAISASLTAVAVQDPMVFYGVLTYTSDLPEDKGGSRIDPGDAIGLHLGTALAVNLDTSLSFGYQQQFNQRTRVDGVAVAGSYVNTGSLTLGLSRVFASGHALDTTLVVGLTEDSPDFQLNFAMPFRVSR